MKNRVLAVSLGVLLSLSLAGCDRREIEDIQTEDFYAANPDKAKSVSEACALADLSKESAEIYDNCERAAMTYFKIFYKSMMQAASRQEVKAQDEKQKNYVRAQRGAKYGIRRGMLSVSSRHGFADKLYSA